MRDIKLLISSILIICSFFLWYMFASKDAEYKQIKNTAEKIYINVETKGKKIQLDSENPDVVLLLNWQETSSGTLILE